MKFDDPPTPALHCQVQPTGVVGYSIDMSIVHVNGQIWLEGDPFG
jgi:hypothetical protein